MKRIVSLLLATLMVVTVLPVAGFIAAAEGFDSTTTTTYQVYKEDFDWLDENAKEVVDITLPGGNSLAP